jgi:hypothetical protein
MNKPLTPYFGTLLHPARSFAALLRHPHYFRLGFLYMLVPVVAYTLMYVFLTVAHGAPSVFTPWLNIAKEDYYAINRFLLAPSMLLAWLAATSLAQVLSRIAGGRGSFEQTLTTLALAISVSMWGGLLHDLPMSFCSAIGIIDARQHELDMNAPTIYRTLLWIAYSLYFLAFGILFPAAVRAVHGLSRGRSIAIGLSAFVLFQLVFLVFNR